MASGYGMCGHLMTQTQSAYGTSEITSLSAIPIVSESISHTIEPLIEAGMYARLDESPYHEGIHAVEGSVSIEAQPDAMGWFLKSVLGTIHTNCAAAVSTHTFIPSVCGSEFSDRAATPPMTMEINRDVGVAFVYSDLLGNDLSINVANGELLTMETNFIGAGVSSSAASTPTFPTAPPFLWDQFSGSYNSQAITDLKDLTVTVNNNLEAVHTLTGSKTPYRIKRSGQRQIEISGTFVFAAHSYNQAFEGQLEVPMNFHFANASAPHTFTMNFPKVRFKTFDVTMGGAGLVEASFTAGALYDTATTKAATFTLVNTVQWYGTLATA